MRITHSLWGKSLLNGAASENAIPLVLIKNGTFYNNHPSVKQFNPPLFPNLNYTLNAKSLQQHWAVIGPSSSGKSTFLEIIAGRLICDPPQARSFPDLYTKPKDTRLLLRFPASGVQYVGFNTKGNTLGGADTKGAYLSARYESHREATDFSLMDYLSGNTNLNPADENGSFSIVSTREKDRILTRIIKIMNVEDLLEIPVSNLSNGQTRRARIAKALIARPKLLILDEPFLGLDPMTRLYLTPFLWRLTRRNHGPSIVISLKDEEEIPRHITHIVYLDKDRTIQAIGPVQSVPAQLDQIGVKLRFSTAKLSGLWKSRKQLSTKQKVSYIDQGDENSKNTASPSEIPTKKRVGRGKQYSDRWYSVKELRIQKEATQYEKKDPIVEFQGIQLRYGGPDQRLILGDWQQEVGAQLKDGLWWDVRRGDRWGVFGPNGSGKTTLLSLISSDHPQAYSLPIKYLGRSRLPSPSKPGLSMFEIQAHIGQASPEIHNFFPKKVSLRETIENAWAEAFLAKPVMNYSDDLAVDSALRWFRTELDPSFTGPDPLDDLIATGPHAPRVNVTNRHSSYTRNAAAFLEMDVDWADSICFRDLSFSAQRVALFIRAIIKKPDLVILDEAFSGMDELTRVKCMMFLAHGETAWLRKPDQSGPIHNRKKLNTVHTILKQDGVIVTGLEPRQALIVVSHRLEEVPPIVEQWMCLPESNSKLPARFGTTPFEDPVEYSGPCNEKSWWRDIWGGEALKNGRPGRMRYST